MVIRKFLHSRYTYVYLKKKEIWMWLNLNIIRTEINLSTVISIKTRIVLIAMIDPIDDNIFRHKCNRAKSK